MNTMQQELYARMSLERVNVEVMFPRADDEEPVISCRLREWSAGRNAGRMILAGGRTLDEALGYAYMGLCENDWVPLDWRLRAVSAGVVNTATPIPTPIRRPVDMRALLRGDNDLFSTEDTLSPPNVPQNGAHGQPERKSSKHQPNTTA